MTRARTGVAARRDGFVAACVGGLLVFALGAFGAVYAWAYFPLAVGCALVGAIAIAGSARASLSRGLALALASIAVAIALQLVPLPQSAIAAVSPGTERLLRAYDLDYVKPSIVGSETAAGRSHPLSIAPSRTRTALGLFVGFALLFAGLVRVLSRVGARWVGLLLIPMAISVASIGIVQRALTPPDRPTLVYGFWKPEGVSVPFGPFVNPNHYAGWVVMALPLLIGLLYGGIGPGAGKGPGATVEPFTSGSGAHEERRPLVGVFGALAVFLMAATVLMTGSRSGLVCMVATLLALGVRIARSGPVALSRGAVAVPLALIVVAAAVWAGVDVVAERLSQAPGEAGRLSAWHDAIRIASDMPLAGSGMNTFAEAMVVYQTAPRALHYYEAHNDYLQVAAEGGVLVGIPAVLAIALFVRDVRKRFAESPRRGNTYWIRVGAVVGLGGVALQSLVDFSLQIPANTILFVVLAAIALHRSPRLAPAPPREPS